MVGDKSLPLRLRDDPLWAVSGRGRLLRSGLPGLGFLTLLGEVSGGFPCKICFPSAEAKVVPSLGFSYAFPGVAEREAVGGAESCSKDLALGRKCWILDRSQGTGNACFPTFPVCF